MNVNIIQAEKILSPTQISIAPYAINPYRGCPFGCLYCYAQENKSIKRKNQQWGTFIDIKENALTLIEEEIKGKDIRRVLLGSTVECYPPQENDFLLTQHIIEILNKNNIPVTILTKSHLIKRDLALIAQCRENKIYLTINFTSDKIKNLFEPHSSSIQERLRVLKQIQTLDIKNRVHIAPVIPYIQDIESICSLVEKYTQQISIEMYNFKMGSWPAIESIIKNKFPKQTISKIKQIISSKENYERYKSQLQDKITDLGKKIHKRIFFFYPDFGDYYRSDVIYED